MLQKRLFSNYLCSQYQSEIMEAIQDYCLENPEIFHSKVIDELTDVECESISSKKVWIRDMPELQLEFEMALEAELCLVESTYRKEEDDSSNKWFLLKGIIDFADTKNGLVITEISEYESQYNADSDYTDGLSPCIYDSGTEKNSMRIYRKILP